MADPAKRAYSLADGGLPLGQHRFVAHGDGEKCRDCGTERLPQRTRPTSGWATPADKLAVGGEGWLTPNCGLYRQEPACWFVDRQNTKTPLVLKVIQGGAKDP